MNLNISSSVYAPTPGFSARPVTYVKVCSAPWGMKREIQELKPSQMSTDETVAKAPVKLVVCQ